MKTQIKSIFNLIEIFGQPKKLNVTNINPEMHCEQKHHHDFYCDTEESLTHS